ncbi:probable Calcium_related spray protein [Cephalotrichum gorgonifer]|uniref:Probable Calcium_related spray protein n=1 Tax=Cephalotrichum gorgonifer TaxID=2041049 RepID=A0AAE8MPD3_9PEZI|nr:probable Calcium_related spray protein [Cephalotrichum gorgonifer]
MKSLLKTPLLLFLALFTPFISAEPILQSTSLNTCSDDSGFSASLFKCVFTPNNGSASIDMVATITVEGMVIFDIAVYAYGLEIIRQEVNPCDINLVGLCPMQRGRLAIPPFNLDVGGAASAVPGIAYAIPDLDATVRIFVNKTDTGESVACVEANVSNGKTVDLVGVKWATAIIAGLALAASAVVSGLGHSNTAAHIASSALSLFSYFQAQAMLGLTSVHLPPIVASWVQNLQWSMGIIQVDFMQDIFTWYQRSTGGEPSSIFDTLRTISVEVHKRSLDVGDYAVDLFKRGVAMAPRALVRRGNIQTSDGRYVVSGIQRVAFRAEIESTNLFMTGLTFFCLFVILTTIGIAVFKAYCEFAVKKQWMGPDKFVEFRNGWTVVLKGILFRMALIGFPQMTILCLWEFTQNDSPAEMVLAVFFFFGILATLGWAATKVILIARQSVTTHRNPAYILFSNLEVLNKWGFLYVQFRASAYYYIAPMLAYLLVKGMFVALAQRASVVQAVAFIIIEVAALIAASVLRPWMDKRTNSFNIAIAAVNFVNAVFLFIFTNVFGAPGLVVGVVGVVLFFLNAIFSLVLIITLIVSTTLVFFRPNPDARYQFMADDRASFMKSQTQLTTTTELDALAATARGDKAGYNSKLDLDDDNESLTAGSMRRRADNLSISPAHGPPGSQFSPHNEKQYPPHSPVNPSLPLFPGGNQNRGAPPSDRSQSPYDQGFRGQNNSPSPAAFRAQNNSSPWQRGAGYD